jgi:putative endonuclease
MQHIRSNYRCRRGEIDLIMQDDEYLVFVEVRFRSSQRYGGALASIGQRKKARLRTAATHYLQRFHPYGDRPCRFDVVIPDPIHLSQCTWIPNAF